MSTPKKLVVCGGSGFLGTRICAAAASRNWHVTSLSRSGEPVWSSVSSSSSAPAWAASVSWRRADLLAPASYAPLLEGADAVVHSMGILLEADYKGVLQGREAPWTGLARAFAATKEGARAGGPLDDNGEDGDGERGAGIGKQSKEEDDGRLRSGEKDGQLTYELMNRDSAVALARECAQRGVQTFVFISAAAGAPILPKRYITTKREAESTIDERFPQMRNIFIRPGFLYDPSRLFTMALAAPVFPISAINSMLGGVLSSVAGAAVEKPLKADLVAEAVVEAIEGDARGPIPTQAIEALAGKAWRRGML